MNLANGLAALATPSQLIAGVNISTPSQLVDHFLRILGPVPVPAATRDAMISYVSSDGTLPSGNGLLTKQRGLIHMILSLPEWQMV